ncbi:hypothetical protein G3V73_24020, partial [Escherichia coli]|nr:hypothetical protein [Escherichia coli]
MAVRNSKPARKRAAKAGVAALDATSLRISADEFKAWQALLNVNNGEASRLLDLAPNTITTIREAGGSTYVALLCRAVLAGITAADTLEHCQR